MYYENDSIQASCAIEDPSEVAQLEIAIFCTQIFPQCGVHDSKVFKVVALCIV